MSRTNESHKPDCACPACRNHAATVARRQAEAEQAAAYAAVARALVKLCSACPLSGPDVLRNLVGPADSLRILRMAGMDPALAAGGWEGSAPVRRQASTSLGDWGPDHDPRVTELLRRPGVSDAELARVRAEVAQEYRIRAMEKAARDRDYYGLDVPAAMGVSTGPGGVPLQRSLTHTDVPSLGSEQ